MTIERRATHRRSGSVSAERGPNGRQFRKGHNPAVASQSQTDRPEAFAGLQEGALVLADISGYSAFVQQTEVDHS